MNYPNKANAATLKSMEVQYQRNHKRHSPVPHNPSVVGSIPTGPTTALAVLFVFGLHYATLAFLR
jgi:hypothetical protein